jgi:hypothetical protein
MVDIIVDIECLPCEHCQEVHKCIGVDRVGRKW